MNSKLETNFCPEANVSATKNEPITNEEELRLNKTINKSQKRVSCATESR